ncbi:Anaerobic dimethyl sulfoxide reductase chain B [Pirellula sp. SH-Sr6A]|uniref:4Fe-4S dicluster domain-containing protein n=1 Tax=Pirellula sp. SH-Sr6A TaxID=1632865 RepID=UPI00078E6546|nr:4Fe-4S dicluster domain-containing protein [Pirellula sp. SH-Sr6A]AMV34833.1 Anaerobic dimethyl sulfoxide reductase chain B [Pirellula sp. SH-Sr6A]
MSVIEDRIRTQFAPRYLRLEDLLNDQRTMSAVDSFSYWHEQADLHQEVYRAFVPMTVPEAGEQYAFEVDLDACSGCKACVVACHNLNDLDEGETWRKVGTITSTKADLPVVQHVTTACHHCVDPGCLKGCPVKAYEKDERTGIVKHLDDQCFGCKYCTMMCPYEVPQYSKRLGIVRKCDMCSQRLSMGAAPACVQACPNAAIRISVVTREQCRPASREEALVATAPASLPTQPTTQFKTARRSALLQSNTSNWGLQSLESATESVQDGHWPLVAMLTLSQASVGVWSCLCISSPSGPVTIALAWLATFLGVVGVHAALFHLGRPLYAYRVFLGWRTSWLSREAIGLGAFMASSVTTSVVMTLSALGFQGVGLLVTPGTYATGILGWIGAYCSAMIYIATGRRVWSWSRTIWDMAWTILGLGCLGYGSIAVLPYGWMWGAWAFSMLATIPKCIDLWRGDHVHDTSGQDVSARSGRLMRQELMPQVGWLLNLSFITLIAIFMERNEIALLGAIAFHAVHRWIYFASCVFQRMPGAAT